MQEAPLTKASGASGVFVPTLKINKDGALLLPAISKS
jgi:hypothetical protein